MQEKREKRNIIYSNYRNKNAVVITEESLKHLYSKMIVSKVLKDSGCEILTEFPLKNSECDVITFDMGGLIIECEDKGRQESKANKKLEQRTKNHTVGVDACIHFILTLSNV